MSKNKEEILGTKVPVTVQAAAAPAVASENAIWGAADNIESSDLLVSKIFHQQALSQFVQDGKAQAGDWCDSLTGEVLAQKNDGLQVIIFSSYKKLLIHKSLRPTPGDPNPKLHFVEAQEVTLENCNLPWEEVVEDGIIKRQLQYNYFCLLPSKIDELPFVLSLQSTKVKTAKKLNTMIAKLSRLNRPSAAYHFILHSIKEQGDKGSWFGIDITQGDLTTKEELAAAHYWYMQIKSQKVNITEEPEDAPSASHNDVSYS